MGWGSSTRRVVAEKFVPALESLSSLRFEGKNLGCPGIFAGMSRTPGGVQKVCAKKVRAHFPVPIMGLFRGAVFRHGRGARKQPMRQPTEMPTSTMGLMGRFPSLMGRFPTLMGRFPDFVLMGRFTS